MRLTQRDKNLFQTLLDYGLLTTTQIAKIQFQTCSRKALLRRLNKLEKAQFIKRTSELQREAIWYLTHKGARTIGEEKSHKIHINKNILEHDLLLSEVRFSLETNKVGENWKLEHSLRHKIFSHKRVIKENLIVPDALFVINYKSQKEAIALELELHRKKASRYKKIFQKYKNHKHLFGVWYILRNKNLGLFLEEIWEKTFCLKERESFFYFSLLEDIKKPIDEIKIYQKQRSYFLPELFKIKS